MSDLVRHLRHGGPTALAAAKRLLEEGPVTAKLSPAELVEVKQLLPQLKDLFGTKLSDGLSKMLTGLEVALPAPVENLMPDLRSLKEPTQLPGRFATDLQLVRPQLTNHPALPREEKATRLFSFIVPFAQKLAVLLPPGEQKQQVASELVQHAADQGFTQLRDVPTQRDGAQVAAQLFEAKTPEEVQAQVKTLQLDAPSWPETTPKETTREPPRADAPRSTDAAPTADSSVREQPSSLQPQPSLNASTPPHPNPLPSRGDGEAEVDSRDSASRSNKRLGPQMLWNTLHLFRDDGREGRDSAAQREESNRLAVGMALALGFLLIIAMILVMSRA